MRRPKISYHLRSTTARENRHMCLIAVVGPTASGKSELAVKIAKQINGEVISADSRQIYRGLDIGSAKIPGKWLSQNVHLKERSRDKMNIQKNIFLYRDVPHHCIDFINPKNIYTVAEFKKCAENAIQVIANRGKIPIIAGGAGFWVDALVYDLPLPAVLPNQNLRKKLAKKNSKELFALLQNIDPKRAQTVDPKNPRRLIRAIEIAKIIGRVPLIKKCSPYNTLWLGLNPPKTVLKKRIQARTHAMLKDGLVKETKKLLIQGVPRSRVQEFGFEYRATLDYLDGKIIQQELYERIVRDTLRYAKRQMRWFKRNKDIQWILKTIETRKLIDYFLKKT